MVPFETRTFGDANARIDTRDEENVRLLTGRKWNYIGSRKEVNVVTSLSLITIMIK